MNRYELMHYNGFTRFLFNILPGFFHPYLYWLLLKCIKPSKLLKKTEEFVKMDEEAWTSFALSLDYAMNKARYRRLLDQIPKKTKIDQKFYDQIQSRDRKLLLPYINKSIEEIEQILLGRSPF